MNSLRRNYLELIWIVNLQINTRILSDNNNKEFKSDGK